MDANRFTREDEARRPMAREGKAYLTTSWGGWPCTRGPTER